MTPSTNPESRSNIHPQFIPNLATWQQHYRVQSHRYFRLLYLYHETDRLNNSWSLQAVSSVNGLGAIEVHSAISTNSAPTSLRWVESTRGLFTLIQFPINGTIILIFVYRLRGAPWNTRVFTIYFGSLSNSEPFWIFSSITMWNRVHTSDHIHEGFLTFSRIFSRYPYEI